MFIHEAVKKALEKQCYITRTIMKPVKIKPTNTYAHCIMYIFVNGQEESHCNNWNAPPEDLMADDWELCD